MGNSVAEAREVIVQARGYLMGNKSTFIAGARRGGVGKKLYAEDLVDEALAALDQGSPPRALEYIFAARVLAREYGGDPGTLTPALKALWPLVVSPKGETQ